MASAPQPDQELNRIRGAIVTAREKLNNEASFDVEPLTGALESMCEQIAALPTDDARAYAAPLQTTLQLLEALEDDIRQAHHELKQRMQAAGGNDTAAETEAENKSEESSD
jgi:hypothetical protein